MKNFLFADETEFWMRLKISDAVTWFMEALPPDECIAEPDQFCPAIYLNE